MRFAKRREQSAPGPASDLTHPGLNRSRPASVLDTLDRWHCRFDVVYSADGATLLPLPRS